LIHRYPFLAYKNHDLHERLVKACDDAILAGEEEMAADFVDRIKTEVHSEESTLKAAFALFKEPDKAELSSKQVQTMLQYLGFPSTPDDVRAILDAVDKDKSGSMSFKEFQEYVGRMGGSHKLFEVRRKNVAMKFGTDAAGIEGEEVQTEELKAAGILEQEQSYWNLVLPRAACEFREAAALVPCQKNAIRQIRTLAKANHEKALVPLQKKVAAMKYSPDDLWMTLAYIRELAPIIVHVHLDKMIEFMQNDTHYRNQFETKASGGLLNTEVRKRWEKDLFAGAYDNAEGFDRPKYGVLNAMNDYRGVVGCKQYGISYFVLRDVRLRTTFSPEDSANLKAERLAVLDFYAHVLNEYSEDELKETIKIAKSSTAAVLGDSGKIGKMKYKETQIHGQIDWNKHVERLVAHESHRESLGPRLEEVCKAHGWQLSWMDEEQRRMQQEESAKLGEAAWKAKLQAIMEKVPDVQGVPHGFCRKGCGRKVAPGKTASGNDFKTCCRGCALGFGHNLTCGNVDADLVQPGMCLNGCGRPVNPGRMSNGKPYTTCCRSCGTTGTHDRYCGRDPTEPILCKLNCGRQVCPPKDGRTFDTCCRGCVRSGGESHDAGCIA